MRKIRPIITALLLFSLSSVALPQSFTGVVSGRVLDQQGSGLSSATVKIINTETGAERIVTTEKYGHYQILSLPPGKYKLTANVQGFDEASLEIEVSVAADVRADVTLKVSGVTAVQNVTATGESEQQTLANRVCCGGELSNVVTREQIVGLPTLTRNVYELVSLSAGALPTSDSRGIGLSVNGQRSSSGNYVLDGGENNDIFFAGPAQTLPADSIKEFRVITNNYTAEYGRSAGFIANIVSSVGTNQFHGSVYNFNRNSALSANSFGNNANGIKKPVFNRNQFGGTFGGPIKKDKLLFFGTIEPIIVRSKASPLFFVPTQALLDISSPATNAIFQDPRSKLPTNIVPGNEVVFPVIPFFGKDCPPGTADENGDCVIAAYTTATRSGPQNVGAGDPGNVILASGRIDYQINQKMQFFGRYAIDDEELFAPVSQPYSEKFDQGLNIRAQNALLNLTRIWANNLVSESRVTYGRVMQNFPATAQVGTDSYFPAFSDSFSFPPTVPFGRDAFLNVQNLYQFQNTVSYARGNHFFKFGGQYIHTRNNLTPPSLQGQLPVANFSDPQSFVFGILDRYSVSLDPNGALPGQNVGPSFTPGVPMRHYRYNEFSFFVQDSWKVNNRLTLSPGLRWEYFGVLHSTGHEKDLDANFYYGEGSNIFERISNGKFLRTSEAPGKYRNRFYLPEYRNFAPRFGLAYDIFGNGRTVIRSGIGIFFDRNFGNAVANVALNPPGYARFNIFGIPGSPAFINFDDSFLKNPYAPIEGNEITLTSVPARHLDQNLKTAYSVSWNAGIERQVNRNMIVGITYVGASGVRLYSLNNINRVNSGRFIGNEIDPDNPFANFPNTLVKDAFELNTRGNQGHSSYHSMQIRLESGNIRSLGLQFGANYTWSHSIDNISSVFGDDFVASPIGIGFTDAFNPDLDRGDSDFDIRQRFVTNFVWDIPFGTRSQNWFVKNLVAGWGLSGVLSFQTGQPFSIFDSGNPEYFGNESPRPILTGARTPAITLTPDATSPNTFLYLPLNFLRPSAAFGEDFGGTVPRNIFRRPGTQYHNMAVSRTFDMPRIFGREGTKLQLRAEFFNVFNHANLYVNAGTNNIGRASFNPRPDGVTIPAVTVSRGTGTIGVSNTFGLPSFIDNRQIVIAAKFIF